MNSGLSSGDGPAKRRWTHEEERRRRSGLEKYIADHSEDDLIENVLSPAFSRNPVSSASQSQDTRTRHWSSGRTCG